MPIVIDVDDEGEKVGPAVNQDRIRLQKVVDWVTSLPAVAHHQMATNEKALEAFRREVHRRAYAR